MKEVETTILRVVFRKIGVAPCVTISQKTLSLEGTVVRPHCKRCWTWIHMKSKHGGNYAGEFSPIPSEFEKYLEKTLMITLGEELK